MHAHFYPERFIKAVADEGGPAGVQFDLSGPDGPALVQGKNRTTLDVTYWNLEKRIQRMNAQGVTMHALSLTVPMVHWAPSERGAQLARMVNDAMVEAHTAFPNRFVGCAALPIQDSALAVKELDRLAGNPAIRGVYLPTNTGPGELSDPTLFPVYERCQSLNLPVLLHPLAVIGANRLGRFHLGNLLGNPFDTTVAAAYLVFGGVLDRFPRLNIVLAHAGGVLPYLVGRLQHGQTVRDETKNVAQRPFKDYLRRFYYDTIIHDPDLLKFLVGLVGADRVMLGSDYCFDMGYERPRHIIETIGLSAADQDKIFFGNAARLFSL